MPIWLLRGETLATLWCRFGAVIPPTSRKNQKKPQISPLRYAPVEMSSLRPVRGGINRTGRRALGGCPMSALTNVGRKRRAKPSNAFGRSRVKLFTRTGEVMGLRPTSVTLPCVISQSQPLIPNGSATLSLHPNNRSPMEAPLSRCHPEEPTCLRQVKGAMNSTGRRALDGCPMFAPAYVGRKRRAKPLQRFWSVQGAVVHWEEPTCLRQVKGAMNSTGPRRLDGCPMFALANVGRRRRAKPLQRFWSVQGTVVHPEEPTCLRQVKGAMNSTGRRALDGCPMFAPAYVGRKSRAKLLKRFWSVQGAVVH